MCVPDSFSGFVSSGNGIVVPELVAYRQCPYKLMYSSKLVVRVPVSLRKFFESTSNAFPYEFLAYCGAKQTDEYTFVVSNKCVVPKQRVTSASVHVVEPPSRKEYNAVIHRHPESVSYFSDTDDMHINSNNDVSILFVPPQTWRAIVKYRMPCGFYLLVDAHVEFYDTGSDDEFQKRMKSMFDENVEVIQPKHPSIYEYIGSSTKEHTPDAEQDVPLGLPSNELLLDDVDRYLYEYYEGFYEDDVGDKSGSDEK